MDTKTIVLAAALTCLEAVSGASASTYDFSGAPGLYDLGAIAPGLTTINTASSAYTGTGQAAFTFGFDFILNGPSEVTATLIPGTNVSSMFSSNWVFDPSNPWGGPNLTILSSYSVSVALPAGSYRFIEQGTVPNHGVDSDPVSYTFSGTLDVASAVPEPSTWAMLVFGFLGLGVAGHRRSRRMPPGSRAATRGRSRRAAARAIGR
ncbi:MAG: PEP-CTERM sorting domain-containing protein [Xanthobacteraceae bacterium]|nr:PEP-CTERM sorting domain-containing protein [Xanthobacteraceae bacterium]